MKIIVTGARGLVGSAVAAHCREAGDDVKALGHADLDIVDREAVESVLMNEKPDAVINCAAYTDVDGAESNEELCYAVNRDGVGNLARASKSAHCIFLTISTDFVFGGAKSGSYSEQDEPNPLGVYGKAKLAGEQAAFRENDNSIIVRTGWIFGGGGTNFLSVLKDLLLKAGDVTAISDSFGTPTYASDLAVRLRELILLNKPGIYHVCNSGPGTSYYGFAIEAARQLGIENVDVLSVSASALDRPAARPVNSRLSCLKAAENGLPSLPDWKDALQRHLE